MPAPGRIPQGAYSGRTPRAHPQGALGVAHPQGASTGRIPRVHQESLIPRAHPQVASPGRISSRASLVTELWLPSAGETPLALAAGSGLLATVQALLDAGAEPNLSGPGGAAPLHRAASSGAGAG